MIEYQINLDCIYVEPDLNYIYGGSQGNLVILQFINLSQINLISKSNNLNSTQQDSYNVIKVDQFVYLSNYLSGLSVFNVEDLHNPIFVITLRIVGAQSIQSYVFQTERLLYSNSEYFGVCIVDISELYADQSKFINSSEQSYLISKVQPDVVLNQFAITPDEKLFFLGVRSIGIQIYDISNIQNKMYPVFLQLIASYGSFSNLIFFGSNYRYFAVCSQSQLFIFQQTVAFDDQDYIGLYRQNLSVNILLDQIIDDYYSLCLVNNQYLVVRGGLEYQFYVFDLSIPYSYSLIIKATFLLQEFVVNGILKKTTLHHLAERQYLILAYSKKIFVYETQSKNSLNQPQFDLVHTFSLNFVYQINDLTSSRDENYLFMCYSKFIVVIDITDIHNFKVIQVIDKLEQFTNDFSSIALTHDDRFGIITVLQQAAIFFEISSDFQIKYLSNLNLYGAFQVEYDKGDRDLFFIADGISGVTIIDSSDRKNPKIKQNYSLNKQIIQIFQPFSMQNSLLLNESQRSVITVINFSNLDKIQTVQSFFESGDEAHYCIIDDFNKVLIVIEISNIKVYFLEKQAKILRQNFFVSGMDTSTKVTFDFQNQIDEQKLKLVALNDYAQIGEDCMIYFSLYQIKTQFQMQSLKIFYEPYEQQNNLPSWIIFDKNYQIMQFNPPKELFSGQNMTVLFQISIQTIFEDTDFILSSASLDISSANSQLIYQNLIKYGWLNKDGFVSQDLNPFQNFPQELIGDLQKSYNYSQMDTLLQYIRIKLIDSSLFYFFSLNINRSLFLVPSQQKCQYDKQEMCYIQSLSTQVSLTIYLLNKITYFMNQTFDGILSQFYQNNTILLLQGQPEIINSYLIQNLSIYSQQTIRNQYIQFKLSDKVDSDWQSQYTYDQVQFIWYKKNITNLKTIQDLYEQKYPSGLQVEAKFELQININEIYSFHPTLTLKIKGYFDKNYTEQLPQQCINSWICFDGQILQGLASLDQYGNQYTIYFSVTDGYELHEENLLIDFRIYSTKQILKISALISGILFTILLCYILRQKIHRIFFYKYYLHSTEYIHNNDDGKLYKKMLLRQFNWKAAHKIFLLLKESFQENENAKIVDFDDDNNQDKCSTFYLNYFNQIGDLNEEEFITDCQSIVEKNQSFFPNLQVESLKKNNSQIKEALISIFYKYALYIDQNSYYVYSQIKNNFMKKYRAINWYKSLIKEKKIQFQQGNQLKLLNYDESSSNTKGDNTQKSSEDTQQPRIQFQELQINNEELKKCLSQLKQQENHKFGLDYDIKIIQNAIKSDYFGFDYIFDLKSYKQCFGESLHITNQQIGEILCFKKEIKNILDNDFQSNFYKSNKFLSQFIDNLNWGYKKHPIVLSKIEDQKDVSGISYDIELDSITFKIDLENLSQGQYKIQLFNTQKYLIFQFSFLILFKTQLSDYKKKIKMFTFSSSQNIFQQQNSRKQAKYLSLPKNTTTKNSRGLKIGLQRGSNLSLQSIIKRPNNNLRKKEKNATLKFEDDSFSNHNFENIDF